MTRTSRRELLVAVEAAREVAREPDIRRLEFAWFLSIAGDWAFLVVGLVAAYGLGGPSMVGWFGVIRMLPAILAGPIAGALMGRVQGERTLLAVHLVRVCAAAILAVVLSMAGGSAVGAAALFISGAVVAAATAVVRPTQSSLLPMLVRSPGQLVAANVASSTSEGLGVLLGPAVGGLLIAAMNSPVALAAVAIVFFGAAIATAGITHSQARVAITPGGGIVASIRKGASALVGRPGATVVIVDFLSQTMVRGLLTTCVVVASIELLGTGEAGVGGLNAAIGLGGLAGSIAAVGLAGRRRLGPSFAVALSAWGLPIALVAVWPDAIAAAVLLFVVGAANAALDVSGFTLLQRNLPNDSRAAVLGLFEGLVAVAVAFGTGLAPVLISAFGIRGALAMTGSVLPIVAIATWPRIRDSDDHAVVPHEALALLRGIPMLAPLALTVVERLAVAMEPRSYDPGEVLMRQGDVGNSFLVIASGSVEVTQDGRLISRVGAGGAIGEIAILRDVPRTATVVAIEPLRVQSLRSVAFVAAISGTPASVAAADMLINERLANTRSGSACGATYVVDPAAE